MSGAAMRLAMPAVPLDDGPAYSLPVSWYFDERVLDLEKRLLFGAGPGYVGHERMVPQPGDYCALASRHDAQVLVRNREGVALLSNVCRHRQATITEGQGRAGVLVCPVHRWSYDLRGRLLSAPHFECKPERHLQSTPLQCWNGLLFDGQRDVAADLAGVQWPQELDFSGCKLDRVVVEESPVNWKSFIETYQENYHLAPCHAGLGRFVDAGDLRYQFGERFLLQQIGISSLDQAGSAVYRRWHEAVRRRCGGAMPRVGAIWFLYYPNVMVEWYPFSLVVSTIEPTAVDRTRNTVEFYYPEEIVETDREFIEAAQAAYFETAREDEEACLRMQRGRHALYLRGLEDAGPAHPHLEPGVAHFHAFVRSGVEPHL